MKAKKNVFIFLLLFTVFNYGQTRKTEVGIITDNDLYSSSRNDKYYTNGLEFFYRHLIKNNKPEILKKSIEFRLGQYIYTPKYLNSPYIEIMDRPFAGYLFGEIGENIFFKNESVFQADMQIGYVGPNSFAKELQKSFHNIVGYKMVRGWEYQIQNTLAVQTHFLFSKKLLAKFESKTIDFHFQSEASLGTIFTGASAGILTRFGFKKLVPMYNSNLHGGSIGSDEKEFYFYIAPSINYQLYDATIQGSIFNNNSSVTFDLVPLRFNGEAGFKYRKNNLNLFYVFVYRGKELYSKTISGYFYGSIGVSYLLN